MESNLVKQIEWLGKVVKVLEQQREVSMARFAKRPLNLREMVLLDTMQAGLTNGNPDIRKILEFLESRAVPGFDPGGIDGDRVVEAVNECLEGVITGTEAASSVKAAVDFLGSM